MGLSSSKQTTNTGPSDWAKPQLTKGIGEIQSAYDANKGPTGEIASGIQGLIPGLMEKYNAGNAGVNAAEGYNTDVLSGKFLDGGNPWLESVLGKTRENTLGAVGGAFGSRGAFGGTKYAEAAGRGVADAENTLRYNDHNTFYNNERNRMDAAAGRAPSTAAADYLGITPLLSAAQTGTDLAFAPSNNYAEQLARLLGNSTTTTQKSSGNVLGMLMQGAGAAAGAYAASDRRLKTNIRKTGELDDGLGVYEFAYKWAPDEMIEGVMADEVADLRPWALGPVIEGYATVRYGAL